MARYLSLTYGVLPTKAQFMKAYEQVVVEEGDSMFKMRLVGHDRDAARGTVFEEASGQDASFTADEMWKGIQQLVRRFHRGGSPARDAAGDLASLILGVLGIDWV